LNECWTSDVGNEADLLNDDDVNEAGIPRDEVDIPIQGVNSNDGETEARQELNGNTNESANEPMEAVINEEDGGDAVTNEEDGGEADISILGNEVDYANEENVEDAMNERMASAAEYYSHLHTMLESTTMMQSSMKKGNKVFGPSGIDALLKELKQLRDRKAIAPKRRTTMSKEDKKASLQYLMFLKKKRTGVIKGRGCTGGRKQRPYTAKEDASLPCHCSCKSREPGYAQSCAEPFCGRRLRIRNRRGCYLRVDEGGSSVRSIGTNYADNMDYEGPLYLGPDICRVILQIKTVRGEPLCCSTLAKDCGRPSHRAIRMEHPDRVAEAGRYAGKRNNKDKASGWNHHHLSNLKPTTMPPRLETGLASTPC
jgi:hypothetical protein